MRTPGPDVHAKSLKRATLVSGLGLALLVVLFYLFLDSSVSTAALLLKHTPWHAWADQLSLLAHHTVVFAFSALGLGIFALRTLGRPSEPSDWSRRLACICLAALVAIAFVESVKFLFGRCRPQLLFEKQLYGFTWLSSDYLRNSFPSGHTTRIFALATATALIWRAWALPALLLALLVGASRVVALKHYPSDVLAGAWLGCVIAIWVKALWERCSSS